jgi:ankyrin repeat protein
VARSGNADEVRHLLKRGAQPDLTSTGETALFAAIRSGNRECVDALLDAGADVNRMDVDGWTCLWYVDNVVMASHLIARGADPSIGEYGRGDRYPEDCQFHKQNRELRELFRHHRLLQQSGRG